MRRSAAALTAILALSVSALAPTAIAATSRASLTDIENDVMCVACHEPLSVAESPQAYAERAYIRGLIAQGLTKPQIERQLVGQYGPSVLGKPPAHGFNLTVYVLPPAIVLLGVAILALTLPRWRRRARAARSEQAVPAPVIEESDSKRLDEDLAGFSG